ncbi:MAG: exopolyphosphatase [Chitinophagaceae bacterium]|jgi:exopolyphosphatase/guanosine-5'-triphosphate,3'-diphosphate pyrophosphatase|nr:exopolyphosphatase [Chitinophagaceae bacterium]
MRLAAIDIGSNAARLLITDVLEPADGKPVFSKINLVRVPLRLGMDVFADGKISKQRIGMILQTMKAYQHLLNAYEVPPHHLKACATSAMRDAANATDIIRKVKMETGIDIEVISGGSEAAYIYENHIAENMDDQATYLYIDVGGGSTETTCFSRGRMIFKQSFNIGTIRLMKGMIEEAQWEEMKDSIKRQLKGIGNVVCIGSGGNINKVFSLSKKKDGKPLSLDTLRDYYKELSSFSLPERMIRYNLREDRADVIVHALQIYINVMRWTDAELIYVPKIGLADGLVQHLYQQLKGR